jgi:hypothetical protein
VSTTPPSGEWPPIPGDTPPGQPSYQQAPSGYPQQGYGQPGYPQQGAPYGYPGQREHPEGTTVLVLGILSLVVCGLLGPFAWSKGNAALRQIDANPGAYSNRGSVSAGRICGMIASCLLIFSAVAFLLVILLAAASSSST